MSRRNTVSRDPKTGRPVYGKHTRQGARRMPVGIVMGRLRVGEVLEANVTPWLAHTTKPAPWTVKARNRAANKRARANRKANR